MLSGRTEMEKFKLTLTTTYEGFDNEWWEWYLKRLESGPNDVQGIAKHFRIGAHEAEFSTEYQGVKATTNYKLEPSL